MAYDYPDAHDAADLRRRPRRAGSTTRSLRIADVRWWLGRPGRRPRAYDAGAHPGAIFVDVDRDLAGAGRARAAIPSPTRPTFAARLGAARASATDDYVVAYDDVGGAVAARLWWMLDDLGHARVRVLDGGIAAWLAAGVPVETDVVRTYPPGRADASRRVDADDRPRRARCRGSATSSLLDARGAGAIPRRGRADRPGRGPHPDGPQLPDRRQPGPRRAVPAPTTRAARIRCARRGRARS